MVDLQTAINEINYGKIEFEYNVDCCTTPGEVVIYLKTLQEILSSGVSDTEIVELAKAKQEGRLLVLPCAMGDTLYCILRDMPPLSEATVEAYRFDEGGLKVQLCYKGLGDTIRFWKYCDDIGKTIFLTLEAARVALKERESNV